MLEVRVNVKLFYLVKTFKSVFGLSSNSITFDNSDIKVCPEHKGLKVLKSDCDASSAHEGIHDKVAFSDLTLVCHKKRQFVICGCWSEVWPQLETKFAIECRIMSLVQPTTRYFFSEIHHPILFVLDDFVVGFKLVQIDEIIFKLQLFKHLHDFYLFRLRNFDTNALHVETEFVILYQVGLQLLYFNIVNQLLKVLMTL